MTITTDMLLAAGCEIKRNACINGVVWKAFDRNAIPIAVKFDRYDQEPSQWEFRELSVVKPRFRVKARSRPYIPATIFGPSDDDPQWITGDSYIYCTQIPLADDFTVYGSSGK